MVISGGQAVFAVVAKDAATKTLNGVGKAFGNLKRGGIAALRGIATAGIAAATALIGFGVAAVKAAADEELQIIRLNAALRARGFELDKLQPKIEEQILAFRRFGIADEEVRRSIEVGSRFFKNQERLLKVNAVAANIAAVSGDDLASVMNAIGKAAKTGSTRGLTKYLGEIKKGATLMDILTIANEKYSGTAEEIAKSTSAQFFAAQEALNDEFEKFGTQFLPRVTDGLKFFQKEILPGIVRVLDDLGPKITDLIDKYIVPLVDSFDDLAKTMGFEDGFGFLIGAIEVALIPFKILLAGIKAVIDGIVAGIKFLQGVPGALAQAAAPAARNYQTGGFARGEMGGTSSYLQTNIDFSIGTAKQDKLVSESLIRQGTGRRSTYGP